MPDAHPRTMVNLPGRDRRRRVLKDEVLAASANHAISNDTDDEGTAAPRYSEAAGVEHHPQITDFIPRRYRTIATVVLAGGAVTVALTAFEFFVLPLSTMQGLRNAGTLGVSGAGGFASWISAVLLLIASITCAITYSIRRHRIDDFRGRYRVWRGATLACLMMSAISVTGLHHFIAAGMTHLTGWSALRDGAVWWFVLPGMPMGWIGIRALFDARDCRLATAFLVAALVSYSIAAASFLGMAPMANAPVRAIVVGASILMGHWLLLAGVISYARYVILDAQGLIPVRKRSAAKIADAVETEEELERLTRPTPAIQGEGKPAASSRSSRPTLQPAKTGADENHWVDGSRPERRRYESDGDDDDEVSGSDRKLSKADRKRMRRLKSDGRAA